jgi:hypothetical protein
VSGTCGTRGCACECVCRLCCVLVRRCGSQLVSCFGLVVLLVGRGGSPRWALLAAGRDDCGEKPNRNCHFSKRAVALAPIFVVLFFSRLRVLNTTSQVWIYLDILVHQTTGSARILNTTRVEKSCVQPKVYNIQSSQSSCRTRRVDTLARLLARVRAGHRLYS